MNKKIFLICPVRNANEGQKKKMSDYVSSLEAHGYKVHFPHRDTKQDDPTGYEICKTNAWAMIQADEIHVFYDEKSAGSKFDLGVAFALTQIFIYRKKIIIVNESEAEAVDKELYGDKKSFFKALKKLQKK